MNSKLKLHLCIILLASFHFMLAQEQVWSLDKCIEQGIQNNLEIKIKNLDYKKATRSQVSVWNQLLPTVAFYGNHSYNFGSTIDPATNNRVSSNIQYDNFYINASMNLVDFNSIALSKQSKIESEKAKVSIEILENEYQLQVLESYFQALFSQELVKIQKTQLQNSKLNLARIEKEVSIGSKPKSDLYDIQFNLAQEEKNILEASQLATFQKKQLFLLINVSEIDIESIVLSPIFIEDLATTNELVNPKIRFAKLHFESLQKSIASQQADNLPRLSTFYTFSSFYYKPLNQNNIGLPNFENQLDNNKNHQAGLQLTVPIFNGFRNHRKVVQAKIESEQANLQIDLETQKLKNQIELENTTKNQLIALHKKIAETKNLAEISFTTTQAKFASGKVDVVNLFTVKNQLLSLEYELLKNQLQTNFIELKIKLLSN